MFGFGNKKSRGTLLTLHLDGMHCSSCSLLIDGELEELDGVITAVTSYRTQESVVEYDPDKVTPAAITAVITKLGYRVLE